MTREEKQTVLHCLKSMIDEEVCEECPLYGTTGTDHCEKDCVRLAINALEQVPCTDAISREKVLQIIRAWFDREATPSDLKNEIEQLPPVTPQYTDAEIQKMQDLEFAEIQKAYEIGKEEGSSEKPNKWIPVSERLPEDHKDVLICLSSDQICIGCYNSHKLPFSNNAIGWGASYTHNWCSNNVIAWMPLPEPYKANPTGAERSDKE